MIDEPAMEQRVLQALPFLRTGDEALRSDFLTRADYASLPGGQHICLEGNRCSRLPIVLSGGARIYKLSESGREITLYRIAPGESCIVTASCILSNRPFPAFAVTEGPCEALLIPNEAFHAWMNAHEPWRTYVFELLAGRLATVMEVVEEVAFKRVDTRLATYLLEGGDVVHRTHESIAADLGTSREAVSRILKEFEHEGLLTLMRGSVQIDDRDALADRARRI